MKKILLELTEDTHKAFKMRCLENGQSIKDALVELVHFYIDNLPPKLKQDEK